ncbi:MAG: hypothetical protein K0B07_02175 [DPANN group archaeon]|nr:hypothetical protein [DPANN group archaeon]
MISSSDEKISKIDNYIGQIDAWVKDLPTFGKYVENGYSDKNIDACMNLLYELIEYMGSKDTLMYCLESNINYISFKPADSKSFRLGHIGKIISEIDMDKFKENKEFEGVIGLGFDYEECENYSKPYFLVEYNGVDEFNETELLTFIKVTEALSVFFDLNLKRRKEYPKTTKIKQITDF